jgi:hypothetical protein
MRLRWSPDAGGSQDSDALLQIAERRPAGLPAAWWAHTGLRRCCSCCRSLRAALSEQAVVRSAPRAARMKRLKRLLLHEMPTQLGSKPEAKAEPGLELEPEPELE